MRTGAAITSAVGRSLSFVVEGDPQTKGSAKGFCPYAWAEAAVAACRKTGKRIGPRVIITNDNDNAKAWQETIAQATRDVLNGAPMFAGAVVVDLAFYLPRPQRIKGGTVAHLTRPDVDKLARCALDGLTGTAYEDDGRVSAIRIRKQYAAADHNRPRVEITITEAAVSDPVAPALFT
jgi:Holliday junction resolvase RusA-like endonuclease